MVSLLEPTTVGLTSTQFAKSGKNLYLSEKFADVHFTFNVDGECEKIPAHKMILASASDVFDLMLDGRWKEQTEIEIRNVPVTVFKEFLQFIYLDEVNVTTTNIPDIMFLAKMYGLNDCLLTCEQLLETRLKSEEICSALDLALTFDRNTFKQQCLERIAKSTPTVFSTNGFLSCSRDLLKCILSNQNINCDEIDVFNACIDWAIYNCRENNIDASSMENLKHQLGDCLHLIQFRLMTTQQLADCVMSNRGLFNQEELIDLFCIHAPNYTLNVFKRIGRSQIRPWSDDFTSLASIVRTTFSEWRTYTLNSTEVSIFKVSKQVVWGAIDIAQVRDGNGHNTSLKGKMIISLSPPGGSSSFTQKIYINTDMNRIKLDREIIVYPNTTYEVRMEFGHNDSGKIIQYRRADLHPIPQCLKGGVFVDDIEMNIEDQGRGFITAYLLNFCNFI